jgi:uncharacterized phosphosugar-binding protein
MADYINDYYNKVQTMQKEVINNQKQTIEQVGKLFAETIKNGGTLYAFGASHAGILAEELFYRTGGLALINPLFSPTLMLNTRPVTVTSQMERLDGFGNVILSGSAAKAGDTILIHSVSGRNTVSVDMAIAAKEKGMNVIVITNMAYTQKVTSRHPSGKNLYEFADIVIDNQGEFEDSCMLLDGMNQKIAPTSSVVGCMIVNMIVISTVDSLLKLGVEPPVFRSANVDGGDEANKLIFEKYQEKIHYM